MQKARRHSIKLLRPFVSERFQVLFHSSVRGSFHLSLTVLVHYRSLRSIQPYQMVLADSHKISRVPCYSGYCQDYKFLRVRDYHSLWCNFPVTSTSNIKSMLQSYNPDAAETTLVWAIPRSIATTQGITIVFFSSGYLDVSVLRVCFLSDTWSSTRWVAPFGNLRIKRLFAPSRSLSQLVTSFIASESQGIHRSLLLTFLKFG